MTLLHVFVILLYHFYHSGPPAARRGGRGGRRVRRGRAAGARDRVVADRLLGPGRVVSVDGRPERRRGRGAASLGDLFFEEKK